MATFKSTTTSQSTMLESMSLSESAIITTAVTLAAILRAGVVLYRLYFHPLCCVPGPKLAGATSLHLRYYEVVEGGGITKLLPHLHKEYNSPVIRIAPNHVHINDIEAYKRAFTTKPSFRKCPDFYKSAQGVDTILTTTDPQRHRVMRNAMLPLFTLKDMTRTFLIGRNHITKVAQVMAHQGRAGQLLDLLVYLRALTANFVAGTLLDHPSELVSYEAPQSGWIIAQEFIGRYRWIFADIPFLVPIGLFLLSVSPEWVTVGFKDLYQHCENVGNRIISTKKEKGKGAPQTVFDKLLDNTSKKLTGRDTLALFQQAVVLMIAGTASPATTLTTALFYILKSKDIETRLRNELTDLEQRLPGGITSADFDWRELYKLPYLEAVIKESLRIIPAVPGLLPRVVPSTGLTIASQYLPPGTRISAAHYVFHHNERIFPNPEKFDPDRWLNKSPENLQLLEQYFMPFSKGPRACIGMKQSWVLMYTVIVYLLGRFEMQLGEEMTGFLEWVDDGTAVPVVKPRVRVVERG
ncbi:cytochrome P450 [Aspergillus glaucus CBS 516.65]|uniref:Cytochrome P450 n=1 Tax=Aspergillus glaucus CBS 516.65 TaxID=1160497 RepID=A0A1L9VWA7_ASPGL|nr:hypothetical protein ASPGLDRAFT_1037039 [Aspergillus glaucus CBS 516.65]OJJ88185.1 hypothetical protein ASPGLDRAFT_1037039 [Aspergillus glaucus CBS 516.65]